MNVLGNYKMSKMLTMNDEEGKMEFVDVEVLLKRQIDAGDNPHDIQEMQNQMMTILTVTENEMVYRMPIPEGVPESEVKEAEAAGMIVDGMVLLEKAPCKIEDGALYMYDRSKFLAGTEWVKVSTDVEGELNMVMALWTAVKHE